VPLYERCVKERGSWIWGTSKNVSCPHFRHSRPCGQGSYSLKLLSKLLEINASLPIVVLTAFDEVERAKDAVRRGARAYFVKGREAELIGIVNDILNG